MTEKHSPLPTLVMGHIEVIAPDGEPGIPYDEAVIHFEGQETPDGEDEPEIIIKCPGAYRLAPEIVRAVNGLPEAIAALELATKHLAEIRAFCTNYEARPCGDPDAECPISMGEWFSREDLAELDSIDAALTKLKG